MIKLKLFSVMCLLFVAAVFCPVNLFAQDSKYEQLLGSWELVVTIQGEEQPFSVLVFAMKKDKLTAFWEDEEQTANAQDLKFEKDTLSFMLEIEVDGGQMTKISCKAKLEKEDEMKGEAVSDLLGEIEFSGKRVKKK